MFANENVEMAIVLYLDDSLANFTPGGGEGSKPNLEQRGVDLILIYWKLCGEATTHGVCVFVI